MGHPKGSHYHVWATRQNGRLVSMPAKELRTLVGSGEGSQYEYQIFVVDGKVICESENTSHAFFRKGASPTFEVITLDDMKSGRARGSKFYEAARAEVERQLELMNKTDEDISE
jgi:hypothetical protein